MNITGIVNSRVAARPFARRSGVPALAVAFAALGCPTTGLAVPLLGAAESFVVLDGSSLTSPSTIFAEGNHGASVGAGRSIAGGKATEGNFGSGAGASSAGSAAAAFGASRSMLTPSRNDSAAHRDRAADISGGGLASTLPCMLDETVNGFGGLGATLHATCTIKATGLNESDTQKIIIGDADSAASLQVDSGVASDLSSVQSTPRTVVTAIIYSLSFKRDTEIGDYHETESSLFQADKPIAVSDPALNRPGLIIGLQRMPDNGPSAGSVSLALGVTSLAASLPEPTTLALLGFGLFGLGWIARRR